MRNRRFINIVLTGCLSCFMFLSCNSDRMDDEAMYTFTGETVASFCQKDPDLSDYYQLLERCGATSLLSVYGHFTCFVPTNAALATYLQEKGLEMNSLTQEEMMKIVYNNTIRGNASEYFSKDFEEGSLSAPSMSDRYITISFGMNESGQRQIWVNKESLIVSLDNEVHNGVVHVVNKVIEPSENTLLDVLKSHEEFSLWADIYEASGWYTGMESLYDENYTSPYPGGMVEIDGWQFKVCDKCKVGYTLFCEPDSLLALLGMTSLETVEKYAEQYYGSKDLGIYTSKQNPLNQFVAYHMLNRQMSTSSFLYTGQNTTSNCQHKRYEYYETMLQYRLMEIKGGNMINTQSNGTHVSLDEPKSNIDAVNGFIHTLSNVLVYDEEVMRKDVLHKRIRFDCFAIPPQLTNNNIRWKLINLQGYNGYSMTPNFCGDYFKYNDVTRLKMWASEGWNNYQSDEMTLRGWYDFTVRMLPVPPGNYEIRLGYAAAWWRGIAQLFIDGQIAGIPVDLTIGCEENNFQMGWAPDEETYDNGVENDKLMRNHGFMKAPTSVYTFQKGGTTIRNLKTSLRIIIGQYNFNEYEPHYFRAKNVDREDREFVFDYIEYIPVDMIRNEDRE